MRFGIYIIGDEILSGKRQDAHLTGVIRILSERGLQLGWASYLPDDPEYIVRALRESFASGDAVFSFGGIGATPDDHTRQCAATAVGVALERHPQAVAEIEARFGEAAYPKRVLMADFPQGAAIIPNPVNRVPGFSLQSHYFLPGFPEMAHPMLAWVLDTYYQYLFHQEVQASLSIWVLDAGESQLLDLMQAVVVRYPSIKLFSLPKLDVRRTIELGVKGDPVTATQALDDLRNGVIQLGFAWLDKLPEA